MIGKKILEIRKKNNLTQKEFAEKINVSDKAVSKWESGLGDPSIDSLKVISIKFDVSLDELILGKDTALDETKSVLENLIRNGNQKNLNDMLEKGLLLDSVDEFGNDIIDYLISYNRTDLIDYLIEKRVISFKNGLFTFNTKKETKTFYQDDLTLTPLSQSKIIEYSTRHRDLFFCLVKNKEYDRISKCLSLRAELPNGRGDGNTTFMYIGLGVFDLDLNDDELKFLGESNDIELISLLVGFKKVINPKNYTKIEKTVGIFSDLKTKLRFINNLLDYNEKAKDNNDNIYELSSFYVGHEKVTKKIKRDQYKKYYRIEMLKLSSWMPKAAVEDKKTINRLAPYITDEIMSEELMETISKKYSLDIFPDSLGFKVNLSSSGMNDKEFIEYLDKLYIDNYIKFPIEEALKRSKNQEELFSDIIVYVYNFFGKQLAVQKKSIILWNDDIKLRNNFAKRISVANRRNLPNNYFKRNISPNTNKEKQVELLIQILKYGTYEVLENTIELFYKQVKIDAAKEILENHDTESFRRLVLIEQNIQDSYDNNHIYKISPSSKLKIYQTITTKAVLDLLSQNINILKDIITDLKPEILDMILNGSCPDKDFEQMALLIDHGANLYSSYIMQEDDGWGYMVDVKRSEKDSKKTAVMREMIRNIIRN